MKLDGTVVIILKLMIKVRKKKKGKKEKKGKKGKKQIKSRLLIDYCLTT